MRACWPGLAAAIALALGAAAQAPVEVSFYYPVAVGGPITKIIDGLAADFEKENPGIKVKPIYSGTYQDSITKALTAVKSGEPPVTSILLSTDMFTLIDEDAIVPFDDLIKTPDDQAWLKSFYPAFMENSQTGGKTWGIPFQRSTIVLYWNKEMFKEAGLDPNRPPATWKEMVEYAQKLTKRDASGKVTQWGVQIPSSGFPYWLFQGLAIENGVNLMNAAGTETYYDKPEVIEALQYWVDLVNKYKVHPEGIVEWGTTPKDFFEKKVAMMWTTTGNLTNVKNNAKFDFGVAMLPAGKQRGSPTGGGNFYLFKKTHAGAARGGVQVHQVGDHAAARGAMGHRHRLRRGARRRVGHAGDEEVRRGLPAGRGRARPAAVREGRAVDARQPARDQGAERRPAGGADRHQDAGAGDEGRAARGGAAAAAVQEVDGRPTAALRRGGADDAHDAMALRLAAAAAGGGAARALHALPGGRDALAQLPLDAEGQPRPAVFVGLDNYRQLVDDPIFWQALVEQPLVRARHDSGVDRARAADGGVGQRPHRGPRLPAPRVLHADGAADDRGRQHLALLLHAGVRPARAGRSAPFGAGTPQLARQQEHGARAA